MSLGLGPGPALVVLGSLGIGLGVRAPGAWVRAPGAWAPAPGQASVARWRLSTEPTIAIGGDDDTLTQFNRVGWLVRTGDGSIHASDVGRPVRIFGPDGRYRASYARKGAGPGEAQFLAWLGAWRDTIFTYDPATARISRFARDGRFLQTQPMPSTLAGGVWSHGRTDDGRWIFTRSDNRQDADQTSRVVRLSADLVSMSPGLDTPPRPIAPVLQPAMVLQRIETSAGAATSMASARLGSSTFTAVGRATIWVGDNATDVVRGYTPTGETRVTVRVPWPEERVTDAVVAAERARAVARARSAAARQRVAATFARELLPRSLPRFGALLVDEGDRLWIGRYTLAPERGVEFAIFDAAGRRVATLEAPPGLRIFLAGEDWVAGVHADEDDVQTVRVYRLERR